MHRRAMDGLLRRRHRLDVRLARLSVALMVLVGTATIGLTSASAEPSNEFSFGKLKRDKQRGTAELAVILPGPGYLALRGKGVVPSTGGALVGPGTSVPEVGAFIKTRGPKKRLLNHTGRASVLARMTYTPQNGTPNTETKRITLIKRG